MTIRRSFLKTAAWSMPALIRCPTPGFTRFPDPRELSPADSWVEIRKLCTLSPERIYLNTGGLGPAQDPVLARNATEGKATVATGLRLEAGDEIVIDSRDGKAYHRFSG